MIVQQIRRGQHQWCSADNLELCLADTAVAIPVLTAMLVFLLILLANVARRQREVVVVVAAAGQLQNGVTYLEWGDTLGDIEMYFRRDGEEQAPPCRAERGAGAES